MEIDHQTAAGRIGAATSLEAKRAAAVEYLRLRGKYIVDPGCGFVPTGAASTDVRKTIVDAKVDAIVQECGRRAAGVPAVERGRAW